MKNIAIFASGGGSNAQAIIDYFEDVNDIQVSLIVASKSTAGVIDRATRHKIPFIVLNKKEFYQSQIILDTLVYYDIDLIVLAGFLWLIPEYLIHTYPNKIINIHPALLPSYGGKGMYGIHVHRAVKANCEKESGITIHLVNKEYDKGRHLFQASCKLSPEDTPEEIAAKVLKLEHKYFPKVIHHFLTSSSKIR